MLNKILIYSWIFSVATLMSCSDDDEISPEQQLEIDAEKINDYLESNNLTADIHPSGLRYIIRQQGGGARPTINDNVTINYEGRFLDEEVFDSNEEITFPLRNLIPGWQIGVPLLQVGGSITLFVPSGLAYGPSRRGSIPANSVLIFDIDLLEVPQ